VFAGIACGRQIGFEGLTGPDAPKDDFATSALSRVLKAGGVLGPAAKDRADSDSEEESGSGALDFARRLAERAGGVGELDIGE
jgi:hypothetical protein